MGLGSIADRMAVLERYLREDTVLSLWLLALTGETQPELGQLMVALQEVEGCVILHLARLRGAEIRETAEGLQAVPLPPMEMH